MTAKLVISGIWVQYIGKSNDIPRICSVSAILRWKPIEELRELVNEPLPKTIQVIDFDRRKGSVDDCDVVEFLGETYGLRHPSDVPDPIAPRSYFAS